MSSLSRVSVVLALLGAAAAVPAMGAVPAHDPDSVQRLVQATAGRGQVTLGKATGTVRFVKLPPDATGSLVPSLAAGPPAEQFSTFMAQHGSAFGVRNAATELRLQRSLKDPVGTRHLTYLQVHQGVPVFAGLLRAHYDRSGRLQAVNGNFVPGIDVSPAPRITGAQASEAALRASRTAAGVTARRATLYVYREGMVRGQPGANRLAYEVEVGNGRDVREFVWVDASTGKVIDRIQGVHQAIHRKVYNLGYSPATLVWEEGDPEPYTGPDATDINNIIPFSKHSYDLYKNMSGGTYLSYDGLDHELESVNNDPQIQCPNATWNGSTTNYCNGVTADDIVAHEWGHAYTEYSHNLIYAWQSGALNESYSDIFGEATDLLNGMGLDTPGSRRSTTGTACSKFKTLPPELRVTAPGSIAGDYLAAAATFGAALTEAGISGPLVLANDGSGTGTPPEPSTSDACEPLVNAAEVMGKIALVDRGACEFAQKVLMAQNAGAIAVVVANHSTGGNTPIVMGGGQAGPAVTIPSLMVGYDTGVILKGKLAEGVDVTLKSGGTVDGENSVRWLIGEDSTAFGGAIRDMWNPNCYSQPARVSDPAYFCGTDDQGGVHYNSGVPNKAFALLVDGGTSNGETVARLGLTRAAHIYRRAALLYQHSSSDFADHADALEQSCRDLIGVNLLSLTTGLPSGESLTSGNCGAVTRAMRAVEMRSDTNCTFPPMLAKNPPPLCTGNGGAPNNLFADNFQTGAPSWTMSHQGVFAEFVPRDWSTQARTLEGRSSTVLYAPSVDGDCVAGSDDQSGVLYADTPTITVPGAQLRLSFDHVLASEPTYDGGNVSISVNGGPWLAVETSDFMYNPYNAALDGAPNTNPMATQPAWTGSDAGSNSSTWGRSIVSLDRFTSPGDTVRLRFAFGQDGCNIKDGWNIDDLKLYRCTNPPAGAATMNTPEVGSVLTADPTMFRWSSGNATPDADGFMYRLDVGSIMGGTDIATNKRARTYLSVSGLPTDGRIIYVRLWTNVTGDTWRYIDYRYNARTAP